MMNENRSGVSNVRIPTYSEVAQLLRIWEGLPRPVISGMIKTIADQTGTIRKPVDWSDPDSWIGSRLSGEFGDLALRIWQESGNRINPRYVYDAYLFIISKGLLDINIFGEYQLTALGLAFKEDDEKTLADLDQSEGLLHLLLIMAGMDAAKRSDLIPAWRDYLREYSRFTTSASVKESLRSRLLNLLEREFVSREGVRYVITKRGVDYAARFTSDVVDRKREAIRAVNAYNNLQKKTLQARLAVIRPQRFEHLLRELLEAMGYEDIEVVKDSGEQGLTLVAAVPVGILSAREVIRVYRRQKNIGTPAIEQLREVLPQLQASRATCITTGKFARSCKEIALQARVVPVTLIDGGGLVNLFFKYRVGLTEQSLFLFQVDEEYFA
jgi:restriction system protein